MNRRAVTAKSEKRGLGRALEHREFRFYPPSRARKSGDGTPRQQCGILQPIEKAGGGCYRDGGGSGIDRYRRAGKHGGRPAPAIAPAPVPRSRVVVPPVRPAKAVEPSYLVKSILKIRSSFVHGDWYWDEGAAKAGKLVVTVDLAAQVLSVFRDGHEIGTAVMIYGADEKPTPLGVFKVSVRETQHV